MANGHSNLSCFAACILVTLAAIGLLSVSAFSQETVSEMMERVDKGDAAAADRLGHASVFWTNDVVTFLVKLGDRGIPILNEALDSSDPGEKGFYSDWCGSGRIVIRRNILRALSGARDARSIPYLIRALPVTDDCSPSFSPCYLCVSSPSSPLVGFIAREVLIEFGRSGLPALTEAAKSKNPYIRGNATYSAIIVGGPQNPRWLDLINKGLHDFGEEDSDGRRFVRKATCDALVRIGEAGVAPLRQALNAKEPDLRREAAGTLMRFHPHSASVVHALLGRLDDLDFYSVGSELVDDFQPNDGPIVPILVDALKNQNANARSIVIKWLGQIGPAAAPAVPALISRLGDSDVRVRTDAADSLGQIGPVAAPAIPALIRASKRDQAAVRESALRALHAIGPAVAPVVPALISGLNDRNADVRNSAAGTLQRIGPEAAPAVPALIRTLKNDPDSVVRVSALTALRSIGPAAVPDMHALLVDALVDKDSIVRATALEALGQMDKEALPVALLVRELKDRDEVVRMLAADLLGRMGQSAAPAVPALINALGDRNNTTRRRVADALAQIGPEAAPAIPALISALNDSDLYLRESAADALGQIGPAAAPAVPALIIGLRDSNEMVRWRAAHTLGQIGPAAVPAIPELKKAMQDSDPFVRDQVRQTVIELEGIVRQ